MINVIIKLNVRELYQAWLRNNMECKKTFPYDNCLKKHRPNDVNQLSPFTLSSYGPMYVCSYVPLVYIGLVRVVSNSVFKLS